MSSNQKYSYIIIFVIFLIMILLFVPLGDKISIGKKVGIIKIDMPITSSEKIIEDLNNFLDRSDILGIILRLDTPGGGVAASQEIYEKVKRISNSNKKPIIASMGGVAASGGYYIALGADTIIANPGTIVGSIGVVINYPIMAELFEKVGVDFETVKSGELKDVGSYSRKVSEADRVHLNEMVDDMHNQFVTAITDNRAISKEKVISLADGSVYTGLKSKELGLIDLIGTFEDAIKIAGTMGQISGNPKTIQVNKKRPPVLDWLSGSLEKKVSDWFDELPAYRWRME